MTIAEMQKKRAELHEAAQGVTKGLAADAVLSVEQLADVNAKLKEIDALDVSIKQAKDSAEALAKLNANGEPVRAVVGNTGSGVAEAAKAIVIPANAKRHKAKHLKSNEDAYAFGQWFRATVGGNGSAQRWCKDHGIPLALSSEGDNTAGGYLVPNEFDTMIIDLREQYGIARLLARVTPMSRDTKTMPRRVSGLNAYFTGEGAAMTESTKVWDQVELVAKKLAVITRMTKELSDDAVINVGDDAANEIAYAFALKEDQCFFNGDGTSTYGGITGVREKIKGLSGTIANIAGLFVGSGNAYSELVLTDFENVQGLLPQYADRNARWVVHKKFYETIMKKLVYAAGGVSGTEINNGVREQLFLGYPVTVSQVMPSTEGNSQVCALFGDFSLAATIGDRAGTTISSSDSASVGGQSVFERDEIAIKGTTRFDINVHDVGNASATAADRVAGPVVGLITAAS